MENLWSVAAGVMPPSPFHLHPARGQKERQTLTTNGKTARGFSVDLNQTYTIAHKQCETLLMHDMSFTYYCSSEQVSYYLLHIYYLFAIIC